jgi:alkyl sulfatase BDS1-like metallo-beta-lactamase superfamily hydrolase
MKYGICLLFSAALSTQALAQVPMTLDPVLTGSGQTEALKILDQVYQATGFGNTLMVTTPEGNVIIDTSLPASVPAHRELLLAVSDAPVRYIILTHAHGDHVGGVEAWRQDGTQVVAQAAHVDFLNYERRLAGLFARRNAAQFPAIGGAAMAADNPLLQQVVNYGGNIRADILFEREHRFTLGGLTFELYHTPGETPDHLTVWIPELKAAFIGDNFYGSFPNVYTLRGTQPRWALDYTESLDFVMSLNPEVIIPSHGEPIYGNAAINTALTRYRDAILYVHDETVRGMNQGKDVYTLMQEIALPSDMQVGEGYGTLAWTVRGIYEGYVGWFDENPSTMYAYPVSDVYPDLLALAGGAERVAEQARAVLTAAGTDQQAVVRALHLADVVLKVEPGHSAALRVRLDALNALLAQSTNSNEAGWLRAGIRQAAAQLQQ